MAARAGFAMAKMSERWSPMSVPASPPNWPIPIDTRLTTLPAGSNRDARVVDHSNVLRAGASSRVCNGSLTRRPRAVVARINAGLACNRARKPTLYFLRCISENHRHFQSLMNGFRHQTTAPLAAAAVLFLPVAPAFISGGTKNVTARKRVLIIAKNP